MPLTETAPLGLETLPTMNRNKPNDNELYGRIEGLPVGDRGFTKMLLLNPAWHDMLGRDYDKRAKNPENWGVQEPSEEQIEALRSIADQARCVASLARLVGRGPGELSLEAEQLPAIDMNDFITENPYFYLTAREASQEGKDPRYVARVASVNPYGYTYSTKEVKFEVEVEGTDGSRGEFPQETRDWHLAHLALGSTVFMTNDFRYLNDGRR